MNRRELESAKNAYESAEQIKIQYDDAEQLVRQISSDIATINNSVASIPKAIRNLEERMKRNSELTQVYQAKITESSQTLSSLNAQHRKLTTTKFGGTQETIIQARNNLEARLSSWEGVFRGSSLRSEMRECDNLIRQIDVNKERIAACTSVICDFQAKLNSTKQTLKSDQALIASAQQKIGPLLAHSNPQSIQQADVSVSIKDDQTQATDLENGTQLGF